MLDRRRVVWPCGLGMMDEETKKVWVSYLRVQTLLDARISPEEEAEIGKKMEQRMSLVPLDPEEFGE